jgi:hypothetical protein
MLRLGKDDRAPIAPIAGRIRLPVRRHPGVHLRDPVGRCPIGADDIGLGDLGAGPRVGDRLGADVGLAADG